MQGVKLVYENVAKYLKEKGIKQSVLADAIGIHPQSMSMTMLGRRTLTAEEYRDICLFLEVPFDKFMEAD